MNRHPSATFGRQVRIVVAVATIVAIVHLFTRAIVPTGRFSATTRFAGPAPYLSEPKPAERIGDAVTGPDGEALRPLKRSPVFLDIKPPASFETATVELRYRADGARDVEVGALVSGPDGSYEVHGVMNALLESSDWPRVSSGRYTLFQRRPTYGSVDDFLARPPAAQRIATYRTDPPAPFRISGYAPSGQARTEHLSLRGGHSMLTYVKDETLEFAFAFQDMNRESGEDEVIVTLSKLGDRTPLRELRLPDDGNVSDDQKHSALRRLELSVPGLAEGAYRLEVSATPDVFIRELRTTQSKLVFEDRVFLGDMIGYSDRVPPAAVFAPRGTVTLRTPHAEGMQTVEADGAGIAIDTPGETYAARIPTDAAKVSVPKRNMLLEASGPFAFSRDAWFDPWTLRIGADTDPAELERRGVDFILADYVPPRKEGGLLVSEVRFSTDDLAHAPSGGYRFAIHAVGGDDVSTGLLLESARFRLRSGFPGFWFTIMEEWRGTDALRPVPGGRIYGDNVE